MIVSLIRILCPGHVFGALSKARPPNVIPVDFLKTKLHESPNRGKVAGVNTVFYF
jgi:hypothetical protein